MSVTYKLAKNGSVEYGGVPPGPGDNLSFVAVLLGVNLPVTTSLSGTVLTAVIDGNPGDYVGGVIPGGPFDNPELTISGLYLTAQWQIRLAFGEPYQTPDFIWHADRASYNTQKPRPDFLLSRDGAAVTLSDVHYTSYDPADPIGPADVLFADGGAGWELQYRLNSSNEADWVDFTRDQVPISIPTQSDVNTVEVRSIEKVSGHYFVQWKRIRPTIQETRSAFWHPTKAVHEAFNEGSDVRVTRRAGVKSAQQPLFTLPGHRNPSLWQRRLNGRVSDDIELIAQHIESRQWRFYRSRNGGKDFIFMGTPFESTAIDALVGNSARAGAAVAAIIKGSPNKLVFKQSGDPANWGPDSGAVVVRSGVANGPVSLSLSPDGHDDWLITIKEGCYSSKGGKVWP